MRHVKRVENDRVFVLLEGLNKNLDEVRGRILGRKPLCHLSMKYLMKLEGRRSKEDNDGRE